MSREFYDVEKQVHRESEGQDTITPLTNAFFLKQIGRLKSLSASNKSLSSIHSSSSLSNGAANPVEFEFETKSMMSDAVHFGKAKNRLDIPRSFLSIFRSDKASKTNISELFNESVRLSPTFEAKRQPDADDINLNTTFYSNITSHTIKQSAQNLNQTDKVFDALSNIIIANTASNHQTSAAVTSNNYFQNGKIHLDNEFIENVKLIVRENEANKKRKINKSRFMCSLVTFLFFVLMFMLICYFLITLNSIASNFRLNIRYKLDLIKPNISSI